MNCYKVSLLRLGHAMVKAESKEEAAAKAEKLPEEDLYWMAERDGFPAPYLVTVIERVEEEKY